jgi:hypothetical protein
MAMNWTVGEAAKVIIEGTDKAAMMDIGRRFPLFSMEVAKIGEKGLVLFEAIGKLDYLTARKFEAALKSGVEDTYAEKVEAEPKKESKKESKKEKVVKEAPKTEEIKEVKEEAHNEASDKPSYEDKVIEEVINATYKGLESAKTVEAVAELLSGAAKDELFSIAEHYSIPTLKKDSKKRLIEKISEGMINK